MREPLREAVLRAGGLRAFARELGVSHQAIMQWHRPPAMRVLEIERLTGVSRHDLRPDLYPVEGVHGAPALPPPDELGASPPGPTVQELLDASALTMGFPSDVSNMTLPSRPDVDTFFKCIDEMLGWTPKPGKTNGEEWDFAATAAKQEATLLKHAYAARDLLIALCEKLDERPRPRRRRSTRLGPRSA